MNENLNVPFTLLQAFPHKEIPVSRATKLGDLPFGLLTVTQKDDSLDPLSYLETCSVMQV